MSQNTSEPNGNSSRDTSGKMESKRNEGFEGMNYEQRRQPYQPQQVRNNRQDTANESNGNNRTES
jgi:hypothetical protein